MRSDLLFFFKLPHSEVTSYNEETLAYKGKVSYKMLKHQHIMSKDLYVVLKNQPLMFKYQHVKLKYQH